MEVKSFEAVVSREGKWWMVAIPAINGLTQARRVAEAELMAREYIAVALDLELDEVEVSIRYDIAVPVGTGDVAEIVSSIKAERQQAQMLEQRANEAAEQLAKALAAKSVPLRDVGEILGVSHQRAHQLVSR